MTAACEFYIPDAERCQKQSEVNKQGSSVELVEDPAYVRAIIEANGRASYADYETLLAAGLAKELARTVLPLGTYTEWYWQCDLHNVLHLLDKRIPSGDNNPQYETTVYAEAMLTLAKQHFGGIISAWERKTGRAG